MYSVVAGHADRFGPKLAVLTEEDGTRTYLELADRSKRLAQGLMDQKIEVGSRVSIWMPNYPEYIDVILALDAAGLSAVTVSPQWTDTEFLFVLEHSKSRAIVTDEEHLTRALALKEKVSTLDYVVLIGAQFRGKELPPGTLSLEQLIADVPSNVTLSFPELPDDSEGSLAYTSGTTTGRPKAVVMKRAVLPSGVSYTSMWGISDKDRCLTISPFFHGNGLYGGALYNLSYGASVVFPRKFSARRFWSIVDRYRPSYMVSLIGLVNILMTLEPSALERSHSFRLLVVLGSAPMAEAIEERYDVPVMDWYGMTEGGAGTYTRLDEPRRPGSAGRPFPGSTMAILRPDGSTADVGEVGEVGFRPSSTAFDGYLDDPEASAAIVHDGWVWTGDLGHLDADGFFYFADRQKDIIRRGGENMSTLEIEAALRLHPDVADVAVVAQPDPVLGERVAAFVVTHSGKPLSLEEAVETCRDHLASFKLPEFIYPVDALPRTGNGKVEKFRLRERLRPS